jgi:serine/threonine protein phosphatase 1
MPASLILISDIHGCFLTLQELVKKCQILLKGEGVVYLLGDLIDRGPRSKEVVEWAMANRIKVVMGNHEHMMIDHYIHRWDKDIRTYDLNLWINNHKETPKSFQKISKTHIAWLSQLPLYIIPDEYDDLLLSHTGHGISQNRMMIDRLWDRDDKFPDDKYFRVFGHTPDKEPIITDKWAKIDTGCPFKDLGKLTAMLWPSREIVQQQNID